MINKKYYKYISFANNSNKERVNTFIDLDHMKCGGMSSKIVPVCQMGAIKSFKYGNIADLRTVLRGLNPNVNSMAQKNISLLIGKRKPINF